mmetsp:Transcript_9490/g.24197  ORF Transcript_9490/g.24197 Transcript_9490/m.24197 type:complete len:1454 (-) Transcript_9490:818-5179(-)
MYAAWRAKASKSKGTPRLLVPQEESLEAFKANSKHPSSACGVSLAFLKCFKASLEELGLEGKARTTQAVVARLISPAGVVHLPAAPDAKQRTSLDAPRPVSRSLTGKPSASSGPATTRDRQTAPHGLAAKELRTRMWDFIEPHWCGKPSYYVCYAWKGDFLEMLATVVDRISRQQDHKEETSEGESTVDLNAIHVWLDVLALPQQCLGSSTTLDGPVFGPPPGLLDVQSAREVVCSCDRGAVIMLDRDMAVLHRTWPLFEVWLAAYYCSQDVSTSRVYAAIPKGIQVSMLLHLQTSCLSGLDLGRTTSSKPEDKQHIMVEVRHAAGQKRMQVLTSESILRATRGWLRWSGEPQDMALYAALMLQSKEYAQLQYVLNAVEEIHDDEATLKEVRDLFAIYDEDGTGSLEEDEFAQVLSLAGFGPEESRSIFKQVDVDGGGSVELDEFEAWWIDSQRQQNRSCRPKPDLTVNGLVTNLKGLAAMLQRRDNEAGAESVMKLVENLEAIAAGPRSPFPDGMLPPTEVYGDWRGAANNLGFKIGFNDLRPALRMLHGLLMANVDTLALHTSPASLLPSPTSVGSDMKLQKATLAWYIALMAELLSRNPCTLREADFFMREAIDLSAPEKHEAMAHSSRSMIAKAIAKARKESVKDVRNDAQIEAIVTEMVRLKHGKDAIISNKLVAEANVSLSTWMAASRGKMYTHASGNKKGHKGSHGANSAQVQSVIDFTTNYLNSGSTVAVHSGLPSGGTSGGSSTQGGGRGTSGQQVRGSAPPPNPAPSGDGKSHAQLAYVLGEACKAAIEEAKRGGPLEEADYQKEKEQTPRGEESDEPSPDEEAVPEERPEITKSGRRSLSSSLGRRSLTSMRVRLSIDQGNEEREKVDQSPGKAPSNQQQLEAGLSPRPPPSPTDNAGLPQSEGWHVANLLELSQEADQLSSSDVVAVGIKAGAFKSSSVPRLKIDREASAYSTPMQRFHTNHHRAQAHPPLPDIHPHPHPPLSPSQGQISPRLHPHNHSATTACNHSTITVQPQRTATAAEPQQCHHSALAPMPHSPLPHQSAVPIHTSSLYQHSALSPAPQTTNSHPGAPKPSSRPGAGHLRAPPPLVLNADAGEEQQGQASPPQQSNKSSDALPHLASRDHAAKPPTVERTKNTFSRSSTTSLSSPGDLENAPGMPGDAFYPASSYPPPHVPSRPGSQTALPGPGHHHSHGNRASPMPPLAHHSGLPHEGFPSEKHGEIIADAHQTHLTLPPSYSSFMGNSFAKHVAAAREQPRVTTPMVQPMVNAHDLEALRARMNSQAGQKGQSSLGSADAGHQGSAAPARSSSSFSSSHDPGVAHLFFKRDSYPLSQNSHPSGSGSGLTPGMQPCKSLGRCSLETPGKGSRLKTASGSFTAQGDAKGEHRSGLSLMSHRSSAAEAKKSASASKWFSKLSGTSLPGLSKPKPLAPSPQSAHEPTPPW